MTIVDRRHSVTGGQGVKAPCRVATTANITLSGEQTIDGVAVVEGDRVLVKNQTDATTNGIYECSTGNWTRTRDFDGPYDVVTGTSTRINEGTTQAEYIYYVSTSGTIVPGTTSIAFELDAVSTPLPAIVLTGTSTTSLAIGTGSKTFTTQADIGWVVGTRLRAASSASPTNWMEGVITSYSGTSVTIASDLTGGSGTIASWNLSIAGNPAASPTTIVFDTKAEAVAYAPDSTVTAIRLNGCLAVGDDGASDWVYTASTPSHACYFTTANSRKYKLVNIIARPEMMDDEATDTAAIQKISDYCGLTGATMAARGSYSCGALTVANANTKWLLDKAAVISFPTLGSGVKAITVSANNFRLYGGKLQGPAASAYVANENGIHMVGASSASRLSGLYVSHCEITQFGAHGIYTQFVDDYDISFNHIHYCGYAGAMFLSSDHGLTDANHIHHITPGSASNMYGLSFTHDNTDYDTDLGAGTKAAQHPFCADFTITRNRIHHIAWEGIDTHGCYEFRIAHNRVYATRNGISVTTGSNDAENYGGYLNLVVANIVDAREEDGTVSGYENLSYGITINGGSVVPQHSVVVAQNVIRYKGLTSNLNTGAIQATRCQNFIIASNVIDKWNGVAILVTLGGGNITGNRFGGLNAGGDTAGHCIYEGGPTTFRLGVSGNILEKGSDGTPGSGFTQVAAATVRPDLSGNDFTQATTPYVLSTPGFCLGSDMMPIISASNAAATSTIPLAEVEGQDCLVTLPSGSTYNITTFTGMVSGQRITVINLGSGTATITRNQAKLDGGSNKALAQDRSIVLQFVGSTAYQTAAVMANS